MTAELDHIVVGAATLAAGADWVASLLGVRPAGGGAHPGAGTHNHLLGLGPRCYLEVIASDPDQVEPPLPRLFRLDAPGMRARLALRPALIGWVARVPVLEERHGTARPMARGDLSWRFAAPPPGQDFDGLMPAWIAWDGTGAAERLPDSGCRLLALEGEHPAAQALTEAIRDHELEELLRVHPGPRPRLRARFRGTDGRDVTLA